MTWSCSTTLWVALCVLIVGCTPVQQPSGSIVTPPALTSLAVTTRDGLSLPLRSWLPELGPPRAIILALHGFNDYANAFATSGEYFAKHGIAVYAYDQRGFGAAPYHGLWPGTDRLVNDLDDVAGLLRRKYPQTPLFLLGESMGGAVIMAASARVHLQVDGLILVAPAVWGGSTMPLLNRISLFLTAHTMPWLTLSGRGLHIKPSDNIEMLRALSRDPLVIKETRVDAIYGVSDLMDEALVVAAGLKEPFLLLYGAQDEVIPQNAMTEAIRSLPQDHVAPQTVAHYEHGYHMLLRDLKAEIPLGDIVAWTAAPGKVLPSQEKGRGDSVPSRSP